MQQIPNIQIPSRRAAGLITILIIIVVAASWWIFSEEPTAKCTIQAGQFGAPPIQQSGQVSARTVSATIRNIGADTWTLIDTGVEREVLSFRLEPTLRKGKASENIVWQPIAIRHYQNVAPKQEMATTIAGPAGLDVGDYEMEWRLVDQNDDYYGSCVHAFTVTQCDDGIDNDEDGRIDSGQDGGCSSYNDHDESDGPSDVAVTMTAPVQLNTDEALLTYTVTLQNQGPDSAKNIIVRQEMPKGMIFEDASSDESCELVLDGVRCDIERIDVGGYRLLSIVYSVDATMYGAESTSSICSEEIVSMAALIDRPKSDPAKNNASQEVRTQIVCPGISPGLLSLQYSSLQVPKPEALPHQRDIPLLSFEISAKISPAFLSEVTFAALPGSIVTDATNYSLFIDREGVGRFALLVEGVEAASNEIVVMQLPKDIKIDTTAPVRFSLHADVAASPSGNPLKVGFATNQPAFIKAKNVAGGEDLFGIAIDNTPCPPPTGRCHISVNTGAYGAYGAGPVTWNILGGGGNLFVTHTPLAIGSVYRANVPASDALRLRFSADYENVALERLAFSVRSPIAQDMASLFKGFDLLPAGSSRSLGLATASPCPEGSPSTMLCFEYDPRPPIVVIAKGTTDTISVRPRLDATAFASVGQYPFSVAVDMTARTEGASVWASSMTSGNALKPNNGDTKASGELFIGTDMPGPNREIVSAPLTIEMLESMPAGQPLQPTESVWLEAE